MPSDGNCFFWSVVDQLKIHGIEESHQNVRAKSVNYIIQNYASEYQQFIPETDLEDYVANMCEDSVWADIFVIYTSARAYSFTLKVFDPTGLLEIFNPCTSIILIYFLETGIILTQ